NWEWTINPVHPLNVRMGVSEIFKELIRQTLNGHKPYWINEHYFHDKMAVELEKMIDLFNSSECQTYELITNCYVLVIMKILDRLDEIDVPAIVSHIQSFQGASGGFNDSFLEFYPTLSATARAVTALTAVGEEPLNVSGVRDFVYSMQTNNSIFPISNYEFRNVETDGYGPHNTKYAYVILDILDEPIPYLDELLIKLEGEFADFKANHSSYSDNEKAIYLELLASRTLMFPERGQEIREELLPIAMAFHDSLHRLSSVLNIHKDRSKDGLLIALILMGKADPHMDFYLSPKEIVKTTKETEITLAINNTAYFEYQFNITGIELVGEAKNYYELENVTQENIRLKANEYYSIPLKLNKTTNETSNPLEKIEVKLTGTTPVYDVFHERGHNYTFPFEIFFEITLTEPTTTNPTNDNKEKIKTGVIIGATILTGITIGAASTTYIVKKRRKRNKVNNS
ncbi:MAG: hypothetical protein ACTSO7_11870, partial [Candidatus Heimdallarchaeota archaeon]